MGCEGRQRRHTEAKGACARPEAEHVERGVREGRQRGEGDLVPEAALPQASRRRQQKQIGANVQRVRAWGGRGRSRAFETTHSLD